MLFFSILFVSFQLIYLLVSKPGRIDSVPVAVETILVFIYIVIYFQQYFILNKSSIYNDYSFYLISGLLIYLAGNFFFNILANQMSKQQWENYWHLTYIPEVIKNLLLTVSIILFHKQLKSEKKTRITNVPFLDMI